MAKKLSTAEKIQKAQANLALLNAKKIYEEAKAKVLGKK